MLYDIVPFPQRNDIAILTLHSKLKWGPGVGPICLPPAGNFVGYHATVSGWGHTQPSMYLTPGGFLYFHLDYYIYIGNDFS